MSTISPIHIIKDSTRPDPQVNFATTHKISSTGYDAVSELDSFVKSKWNTEVSKLSAHVRVIINTLKDYVVKMTPSNQHVTMDEKARQQTQLYKSLINALNISPDDSLVAMSIIMFFIAGYKATVFNDRNALTAVDIMRIDAKENQTFRSLIVLLINTCDPVTRKLVLKRQVDLNKVVALLPNTNMQESLKRFYSITI